MTEDHRRDFVCFQFVISYSLHLLLCGPPRLCGLCVSFFCNRLSVIRGRTDCYRNFPRTV